MIFIYNMMIKMESTPNLKVPFYGIITEKTSSISLLIFLFTLRLYYLKNIWIEREIVV